MFEDRFARADLLTDRAFAASFDESLDVDATARDLRDMAAGDVPALAIARARLASMLAHRSTASMARMSMTLLDGAEALSGNPALI